MGMPPRRSYARKETRVKAYCLFCQTEKCDIIRRIVDDVYACHAIYPKQMQHIWQKGQLRAFPRALFPGYVFIYFDEKEDHEWDLVELRKFPGVIRMLSDRNGHYVLSGKDELLAMMLLERGGTLGRTQVTLENQKLYIRDGSLAGLEATILKVVRRKSIMKIQISFAGQPLTTWLEYEIVEPET